jgi:hypothetical protein
MTHKVGELVYHGVDHMLGVITQKYHPKSDVFDKRTWHYIIQWMNGEEIEYTKIDLDIYKDCLKRHLKYANKT